MKPHHLAVGFSFFLAVAAGSSFAEDVQPIAVDLATEITPRCSPGVEVTVEVAKDELDGAPVLKFIVPEKEYEKWRGSLRYAIPNPTPGTYTLTFQAKAEPDTSYIMMRLMDLSSNPPRNDESQRRSLRFGAEWLEFEFVFTIDDTWKAPTVIWSDLAQSGRTFSFRDVRLIKN